MSAASAPGGNPASSAISIDPQRATPAHAAAPAHRRPPGDAIAAAVILLVHGVLVWIHQDPALSTASDDAIYLYLARSLRAFEYRSLYIPGTPLHTFYPPGLPAVLAFASAVAGERLVAFALVGLLASLAMLLCTYLAIRRGWSGPLALVVLAILAVNPTLLRMSSGIRSDVVAAAQAAGVLWLLARRPLDTRTLLLAGALAIFAGLTRAAGVALVLAMFLFLLAERRVRQALAFAAVAGMLVGGWYVYAWAAAEDPVISTYAGVVTRGYQLDQDEPTSPVITLVDLARRSLVQSAVDYGNEALPSALGIPLVPGTLADNVAWLLLVGTLLVAGLPALWRRWRIAALFLLCHAALLTAFPFNLVRFLLPLLPVLIVMMIAGGLALGRGRVRGAGRPIAAAVAAVLLVAGGAESALRVRAKVTCDTSREPLPPGCRRPAEHEFIAAAAFARETTPRDAVLLGPVAASLAWFSDRQTIPSQPDRWQLDEIHSRPALAGRPLYLLLTRVRWQERSLARSLLPHCARLEPAGAVSPTAQLLRLRPPDEPAGNGRDACAALQEYLAAPDATEPADPQ